MGQTTILLADDEPHITCIVERKLRMAGFDVLTARDGEEAFELACLHRPALVVTDLQMPHMSGIELATRLRSEPATAATPVIMLTARGYVLDDAQLRQTRIVHVISKPFSARDLLRQIERLLDASQTDVPADAPPHSSARPPRAEREAA